MASAVPHISTELVLKEEKIPYKKCHLPSITSIYPGVSGHIKLATMTAGLRRVLRRRQLGVHLRGRLCVVPRRHNATAHLVVVRTAIIVVHPIAEIVAVAHGICKRIFFLVFFFRNINCLKQTVGSAMQDKDLTRPIIKII